MRTGRIDAVLFDFDGTLTRPGLLDYARIREEIGCPPEVGILRYIASRPSETDKRRAEETLLRHEQSAADQSVPNDGAEEAVSRLKAAGLRLGILTRNTRECVDRAFANFERVGAEAFEMIITRDDGEPLKPDPGSVTEAARRFGLPPENVLMVGDYRDDITAANAAGAWSALCTGDQTPPWRSEVAPDYVISVPGELPNVLRRHRPLETGKLPNDLLAELLAELHPTEDLVVPPAVGEDVAGIDAGDLGILLAKSDPITFPTDRIGRYAVVINTNDVLCAGGRPRWFLVTAVFPPGTTGWRVREIFRDMRKAADELEIDVIGGHTEISDGVSRPLVSGALLGTTAREGLLSKRNIRPGDRIIMTKRPGVEGTAIIADEFATSLRSRAVSPTTIEEAARFVELITILPEARVATESGLAVALHDVTEGGVATALEELAAAAAVGLEVDLDTLEPYPETGAFCGALGIDPLGLIGSGSLLIAAREENASRLVEKLHAANIDAREIGVATAASDTADAGVVGKRGDRDVSFPHFEGDELARLYRDQAAGSS
ncbi:MAG: HAD-IA family hydrolase [Spirochaetaceae bacterium]